MLELTEMPIPLCPPNKILVKNLTDISLRLFSVIFYFHSLFQFLLIPTVTHVDGTGSLQTVRKEDNHLYWQLIKEFENLTGVPVVLNTSFNENEPIVCTPQESLDCFLRTKMDTLVLGNYLIRKP